MHSAFPYLYARSVRALGDLSDALKSMYSGVMKYCSLSEVHALLYAPVLLGIGIGVYFVLPYEPSSQIILNLMIGASASLLFTHQIYIVTNKFNALIGLSFCIALIIFGAFLAQYRTISVQTPMLEKELTYADIRGVIESVDVLAADKVQRLVVRDVYIKELPAEKTPRKIRLKVRGAEVHSPGQHIEVLAGLNPPSPPVSPNAFDFQRHSYFQEIGAVGFTYRPPTVLKQERSSSFFAFWEELRLSIIQRVITHVDSEMQGVMSTFLTGEKSTILEDDLQAMRDSGLAHLLAISGLHVGLVAGFVFFFSRLIMAAVPNFALQYPIKKYAAGIAVVSAFFYMFLVGASVPTQRAMIMTGIALFAIMIDRSPFSLRTVAIAACAILILYPESLVSASFQMSFAAVTALVWFYDRNRMRLQNAYRNAGVIKRGVLYIGGIAMTTFIAGTATAVYGMYHFQAWSVYSLLANIFAVPVMGSFVMPMAVIAYILMPLGLEALPLYLMSFGVNWILYVAHYVSAMEGAVLLVSAFSYVCLALITFGVLCIMIGPGIARLCGAVCLIFAVFILIFSPQTKQILISDDGKLVGIYSHEENMLYVSSRTANRYIRNNWARELGLTEDQTLKFSDMPDMGCDAEGCRLILNDHKIAFPQSDYAAQQDCAWAEIIISSNYVTRKCPAEVIVDRAFQKSDGSVRLSFLGKPYELETDRGARGARAWTPYFNNSAAR